MAKRPTFEEMMRPFVGRWRIVGADCYDRDYLDLCGEAHMVVPPEGWGEMSFGALTAGLEFSVSVGTLFFDWYGSDEMDESTGKGTMEFVGKDRAEIELEYSYGDEAVLNAIRTDGS